MKNKIKWLDRQVQPLGPYLTLCRSEEEYLAVCKFLDVKYVTPWVPKGTGACTHTFDHKDQGMVCAVCIDLSGGHKDSTNMALLAHEAVHVYQKYCEHLGETDPGIEHQAYGVQMIAQSLFEEYLNKPRKKK